MSDDDTDPQSPVEGPPLTVAPSDATELQNNNVKISKKDPHSGSSIGSRPNDVVILFTPKDSTSCKDCGDIAHVQVVIMKCTPSSGAERVVKPADYTPQDTIARAQAWTTDAGYFVDVANGATPPFKPAYELDPIWRGKKTTSELKSATEYDYPQAGDAGTNGWYGQTHQGTSNFDPNAWVKVVLEFETFAVCFGGKDCNVDASTGIPSKWYEGVLWRYEMTSGDAAAKKLGKSTLLKSVTAPTAEFLKAVTKFTQVNKFKWCQP